MLTLFKDSCFDTFTQFLNEYRYTGAPQINVRKNDDGYKVQMSVPGLTKDDIKIKVKDGMLQISYQKEEKSEKSYFMSSFSKSYSLPEDVKETGINGKVENGVLELTLPIEKKKITERLVDLN